jgi:thiamine pyrophosphokinase
MSKSIIFTGAKPPKSLPKNLYETGDIVIAADSGFDSARKLGFTVDLAIGDFDSTNCYEEIKGIRHEQHSRDKDESDTFLAIGRGIEMAGDTYVLVGGGGGRLDHLLATYSLFDRFGPPLVWYTAYETCYRVVRHQRFEGFAEGQTVSFFPASLNGFSLVEARQLQWPLIEYPLSFNTISLSNRMTETNLEVFAEGGVIFVSFPVVGCRVKMLP